MPIVDITIGKRNFQMACGAGQESHIQSLAESVNTKFDQLSGSMENANDALLLVMTSLMLQDEINELNKNIANSDQSQDAETSKAIAEAVDSVADYVEAIAQRLENK